jgi:Flp pilus assembly protein TadG
MATLLALVAFAVDMGYICLARAQAQVSADAAALAGAQEMLREDRLRGDFNRAYKNARYVAAQYAAMYRVGPNNMRLETDEDVVIGRLDDLTDRYSPLAQTNPASYNALTVTVRATADRGLQLPLFFAPILGAAGVDVQATATVAFADHIVGFRTSRKHSTTSLLPVTVKLDDWKNFVDHGWRDDWAYDPETKTVAAGPDGIPEMKIYPLGSGPGNWGTVDIGNSNNSTAELGRQIRHGVNARDLAKYGGELALDSSTQSLTLNGDTGISAGIEAALVSIVGQPKSIPLYRTATGNGNTMNYEIVGFAGIRIVHVELGGSDKYILVQPAYVVDATAVSDPAATDSYFVTQPLRIVR